jgi:hypothetical protein
MKKQFDYIQDPGHGWVKVPLALIRELGIAEKITRFSYWHAGHVYLEEDCDTCTFMNAYHAAFGFDPKLRDRVARERRSRVRGYDPYGYRPEVNMYSSRYLAAVRAIRKLELAVDA